MNSTNYLTEGHLFRGLITISLPIIASNLLQSVLEVVDLYFVGRLGADAIAGVAMSTTIIFVLATFVIGLVTDYNRIYFSPLWCKGTRCRWIDCPAFSLYWSYIFTCNLCIRALLFKRPSYSARSERNSCHTGFCLSFGPFFRNFYHDRTLGSNQLFFRLVVIL